MDKMQLVKANQQAFNQAYLSMQNTLGGNPIALLCSDASIQAIEDAAKALEQMHHIAQQCHSDLDANGSEARELETDEPEDIVEKTDDKSKDKKEKVTKSPKTTEQNEGSVEQ